MSEEEVGNAITNFITIGAFSGYWGIMFVFWTTVIRLWSLRQLKNIYADVLSNNVHNESQCRNPRYILAIFGLFSAVILEATALAVSALSLVIPLLIGWTLLISILAAAYDNRKMGRVDVLTLACILGATFSVIANCPDHNLEYTMSSIFDLLANASMIFFWIISGAFFFILGSLMIRITGVNYLNIQKMRKETKRKKRVCFSSTLTLIVFRQP